MRWPAPHRRCARCRPPPLRRRFCPTTSCETVPSRLLSFSRDDLHGNSCSSGSVNHVFGPLAVLEVGMEGQHQVGSALNEHLLVADGASRSVILVPVSGKG